MSLLVAEHLEFGYGKSLSKPIDFAFDAGELVCLLGENGCGKSTLLHTLSGFLKPVAGSVLVCENRIENFDVRTLAKNVVLVRMGLAAPQWMTVREFVSLGRSPYAGILDGRSKIDEQIIDQAIAEMDLRDYVNRKVVELSDGERSRVYLAKALAQQVKVLLLDEPDAFLDLPRRRALYASLKKIAKEKEMVIVVSTHSVAHAEKYADKLISFYEGGNIAVGSVNEIQKNGFLKWTED